MKIQSKLTILLLLLSSGVIIAAGIFSTISIDNYFRARIINEMTTQANEFEYVIRTFSDTDSLRYDHLKQLAHSANLRLTLIDNQGKVLFESELPESQLPTVENHLGRPEVREATTKEFGTNIRHSATINIDMLYLAKNIRTPLPAESGYSNVKFLRLGVPLTFVNEVMRDIQTKIIFTSAFVLFVVAAVTFFVSRRIAKPISTMATIAEEIRSGNLDKRIPVRTSDELGRLAESLNSMVDKLNEDISKLKKLERVRSEFLGNVSHELRTPIFAMQGMLETLLHGALDDKEVSRDFVERALKNAERLNTLLGDLIEISRIESGEMKMSFRYFDVNEFLSNIITEMKQFAEQKSISILYEKTGSSLSAFGDQERLKQAVINLIDNAVKYTQPKGTVTVSSFHSDGKIKIVVKDSGIGIAQEHLARIFERFYRVDRERSRESGGTGLGLAIVKHIIEAHGSHVEVQSEVGKGSEFSFELKS
ncbi:MAG: HAMP domain-containing protein [Ignavibacteriae bacterium]|nr:HAMP domain-containing protein [Ignavibacteriota bacterium]